MEEIDCVVFGRKMTVSVHVLANVRVVYEGARACGQYEAGTVPRTCTAAAQGLRAYPQRR